MKSLLKGWNKKWVWSPICLTAYYHSVYDNYAKLDAFASDTIYGHFICTLKTHISCGENNVSKKVVNFFIIFFLSPWNNKSKLTSRGKLHHKSRYLALIGPKKKRNEEKDGKITNSISNVLSTRSCYSKYGFSEIYYGGVGHLHVGTYLSLK